MLTFTQEFDISRDALIKALEASPLFEVVSHQGDALELRDVSWRTNPLLIDYPHGQGSGPYIYRRCVSIQFTTNRKSSCSVSVSMGPSPHSWGVGMVGIGLGVISLFMSTMARTPIVACGLLCMGLPLMLWLVYRVHVLPRQTEDRLRRVAASRRVIRS